MVEDENVAVASTQEEENLVTMTDELEPETNLPMDDQGEADVEMPILSATEPFISSTSTHTSTTGVDKGSPETPTVEAKSEELLVAHLSEEKIVAPKPAEREGHCYW